jgi:hypothetical protein
VLWHKRQRQPWQRLAETKYAAGNFPYMMLAITGQWVAEVTLVLCLFGAACIGLAITAGDWREGRALRRAEQKITGRNAAGKGRGRSES